MTKKIILPAIAALAIGGTLFSTAAFAQADTEGTYPPVIQKLVDQFGVNSTDVDTAMQEVRDEHQAQMQAQYEEYLTSAVDSGDITEDQKQLILDKHDELQAEREQQRLELEQWSEDNNIDLQYLGEGHNGPHGFGKMEGGMRGFGPMMDGADEG
ncbi:hypothetical protein KC571_01755 [candidate division WWE3 bacterium]|uniref:DUF2680 domain-containing protein n=1 Tax=candidate division WWE3 bacterium TaxID=2053526 RepID=A0A955RQ03_UNCKA|nr:hypothetical protein [candidate division WWE3 bacterium]